MATARKSAARKRGAAKKGGRARPRRPAKPKCPNDARKVCKAFNEWANDMYKWAQEVTDLLWPPTNPGPTNPPPKPPFAM